MSKEIISMSFEKWVKTFKPIKNSMNENASYDGMLFETYGAEYETISDTQVKNVWTLVNKDNGDGLVIIEGFHIVNRVGYFVTEIEWEKENYEIILEG